MSTLALHKPEKRAKAMRRPIARRAPIARASRPRARRAGTLAAQKRECDRLFSLIVRARTKLCERCHKAKPLDCAHVVGRSNQGLRHDFLNACALCRDCHKYLGSASLTKPSRMRTFYCRKYGMEAWLVLRALALAPPKKFSSATLDVLRSALGVL